MVHNFPKTKFVDEGSKRTQIEHIFSEVQEIKDELKQPRPDRFKLDEELVDLFHSLETLFRMDEQRYDEAMRNVIRKNRDRDYYIEAEPVKLTVPVVEGYHPLFRVLIDALNQSQNGKGSERHGQGMPFDSQPIMTIPRLQNSDIGLMYQAIKKLQESQRMDKAAAIKERLGAINYIAASILWLEQNREN